MVDYSSEVEVRAEIFGFNDSSSQQRGLQSRYQCLEKCDLQHDEDGDTLYMFHAMQYNGSCSNLGAYDGQSPLVQS